jgi:hypothetical protein
MKTSSRITRLGAILLLFALRGIDVSQSRVGTCTIDLLAKQCSTCLSKNNAFLSGSRHNATKSAAQPEKVENSNWLASSISVDTHRNSMPFCYSNQFAINWPFPNSSGLVRKQS